jgi:hypothetical protein
MKKKWSLALCCLLFLVLPGCRKENDILPENARLKLVLSFHDLTETVPMDTSEVFEYNKSGQISKVSYRYNYDLYEYNSTGQLIKITNYHANGNSPTGYIILKIYSYTYSGEGKKVKETIEYPMINSFEYNLFLYSEGRLHKIENHDKSDALTGYTIYEYDEKGQPVREVLYGGNSVPYRWTIHSFSNGLNVKTVIYADETLDNMVREYKRTFDTNKNLKILETFQGPASSQVGNGVNRYIYFGE